MSTVLNCGDTRAVGVDERWAAAVRRGQSPRWVAIGWRRPPNSAAPCSACA